MSEPVFPTLAAVAAAAALAVGFLKTSIGGGIGITVTPLLTLFVPAQVVLGLTAVMLNLSDPLSLRYYWRQWDRRQFALLLPTVLAGIVLGGRALAGLSDPTLRKLIGATALVLGTLQLVALFGRLRLAGPRSPWPVGSGVGLVAGVASAVAHSGGIIVGPYLVGLGLSNAGVVATGSAVVAVSNILKLATYWSIGFLSWPIVLVSLLTTPLLFLGAWLGYRVNAYLPPRWFALALIAVALGGSLKLLAD